MPERNAPPISFVAIGLLATIGFSIGLDADIFRDVAGAEVSGAVLRVVLLRHRIAEQHHQAVAQLLGDFAAHLRHCSRGGVEISPDKSRHSSASSFAAIPVESTRSRNITVTCRRSPATSKAVVLVAGGIEGGVDARTGEVTSLLDRAAMASSSLRRCPRSADAQLLQVLCRQALQDAFVYLVFAEGGVSTGDFQEALAALLGKDAPIHRQR